MTDDELNRQIADLHAHVTRLTAERRRGKAVEVTPVIRDGWDTYTPPLTEDEGLSVLVSGLPEDDHEREG